MATSKQWALPDPKGTEAHFAVPMESKETGPDTPSRESNRSKNARQYTWVLLLKAHKLAGCLAWLGLGVMTLSKHIRSRLLTKEGFESGVGGDSKPGSRLLQILRVLLILSVTLLVFEFATHYNDWDLLTHTDLTLPTAATLISTLSNLWKTFRGQYIAPAIKFLSASCIWLFIIQSADRLIMVGGACWIKVTGYKPIAIGDWEDDEDVERPGDAYPMVLVQVPMCNEREVYDVSIGAVCQLDWPRHRLLIQVLDDSSDEEIQGLIKAECQLWASRGAPIVYRHRLLRRGYKAGNLNSAMGCDYVKDYEFAAIFDADFQPKPDFLKLTVKHFRQQPELGLVQARWAFVNRDENLLTRLQNINLAFHFEVEQQVNGAFINFFGFNGTAGVWRIKALEDSGGWLDRTTVEDMDIAVRAHLKGWKMIFLNDVQALCELPESFEAYRKQQHRWHSGPMQLFKLALPDIISAKITFWKKFNLIFLFFLLRKMILPFYSFTLFCIVLPLSMFVPEAALPLWVVCYIPATMSIMNILPSSRSFPFLVPYLLFDNCMSVTKFNAMIVGLFQLGSSYEWVVTKKAGRASETDLQSAAKAEEASLKLALPTSPLQRRASESGMDALAEKVRLMEAIIAPLAAKAAVQPKAPLPEMKPRQFYRKELALAFLLLVAAVRSLLSIHGMHFYFLLFQGLAFLAVGLDVISDRSI